MLALLATVLGGGVIGLLLAVHLLSPRATHVKYTTWPTTGWIAAQAVVTSLLKKGRKPSAGVPKSVPQLQVSLTVPMGFSARKFPQYMSLTQCDAGTAGTVPLMYPLTESFRLVSQAMLLPGFPFKVLGSVLARNTTHVLRPISLEERLVYTARVEPGAWRPTPKADIEVDVVVEAGSTRDNGLVWRSTVTVIILNPRRGRSAPSKGAPPADAPAPAQVQSTPATSWDMVDTWRLSGDVGRRYGFLSSDINPIHLYPATSRLFGFKRPIAHALFLVARAEAALRSHGVVPVYPAVLATEFKRPTLLPATLKFVVQPAPDGKRHASQLTAGGPGVSFAVITGDGVKEVLTGKLTVASPGAL